MEFSKKEFSDKNSGMLEGVRIIDLSRLVAGNFITLKLADFGADIIKIENTQDGDPFRKWHGAGVALHWKEYSRNKRSLTLDLRSERGREVLLKLVETADGLVENFRPGTLETMGLHPDLLLKRNPRLVVLRISGFGQTGPYRSYGGFGTLVEAMSGYAERSGFEDREPVLPPLALADNVTGLTGAMAMMMALYHRDAKGGSGQVIDLSLLEPMYAILGPEASRYRLTGTVKKRVGSASSTSSPRNVYKTSDDRWVAMSASIPTMVTRLFRAIGREDMLSDPRYSTNAERFKHRHEVDAIVGGWIRERTLDENLAFFRKHEITVGPVYNISQIVEDPHFIEREILVEVPDEELGSLPMHNIFPRFSKTPGDFYRPAPKLGEHNSEILEELGFDETARSALRDEGIIS
ncbi:CaiB/BaiF CoA transferase family protein [Shinella sp.]|uniref:CaiB/BaiF CoA transferase family protein n=1 Tax=Shinella sp. TaxID=1870904 RepID=UPI003F6E45D1